MITPSSRFYYNAYYCIIIIITKEIFEKQKNCTAVTAAHLIRNIFIRLTRGMGVQFMYDLQITGGVSEADYNITSDYEFPFKKL